MNKVLSIELAKQVFWVSEEAFVQVDQYLKTIKIQLENEEDAQLIIADIELRLAELLYEIQPDSNKALNEKDISQVVDQIGYFDQAEAVGVDFKQRHRRGRKLDQRILAGVCAGLAEHTILPAFIYRLLFVGLSFVFGLGLFLYLMLWLSWKPLDQTSSIAAKNTALSLQKIVFFPVTISAWIIDIFNSSQSNWLKVIFRLTGAMIILAALVTIIALLIEFTLSAVVSPIAAILFSVAVIYLLVYAITAVIKRYYTKGLQRHMDDRLKIGAVVASIIIIGGLIHLVSH
ncbi:PspC domain-containing protein [Marinicella sp. W31]|uniref:PspC domain-containing protein n=1 Tax=Marinicella sp. W31 TaxID=3023713 RepID=UPI003756DE71